MLLYNLLESVLKNLLKKLKTTKLRCEKQARLLFPARNSQNQLDEKSIKLSRTMSLMA